MFIGYSSIYHKWSKKYDVNSPESLFLSAVWYHHTEIMVHRVKGKIEAKRKINLFRTIVLLLQFFLFSANEIYSTRPEYLDSMKVVADTSTDIPSKLNALYTLSFENALINPRLGIKYAKECLRLAQEVNDQRSILNAYNGLGNCYETLGNYDSALFYHQKTYLLAIPVGNKRLLASTIFNVAGCYKELGQYEKALSIYLNTYSKFTDAEYYNPRLHLFMGDIYIHLDNYPEAEYHSRKGIQRTFNTEIDYIGFSLYVQLAKCLHHKNENDSAIVLLDQAIEGLKKNTDQISLAGALSARGELYYDLGNYQLALQNFLEEDLIRKNTSNVVGQINSLINLSKTYIKLNEKGKSEIFLKQAIKLTRQIQRNKDILLIFYKQIAELSEQIADVNTALFFHKKHDELKDSLLNQENYRQLNIIHTQYETVQKEHKIQEQKIILTEQQLEISEKKNQFILLIVLFIIILFTGTLIYFRYLSAQKLNFLKELQKQENIRLNAIREKENEERMRIARNIHDELGSGISKLYLLAEGTLPLLESNEKASENIQTLSKTARNISENMRDLVWTLDPENNTLDNLVAKMHEYCSDYFEDLSIRTNYNITDPVPAYILSKDVQRNLFLAFKEALNNVVKHAGASWITINMKIDNYRFMVEILDNGKGFNVEQIRKTSNGIKNMSQRLKDVKGSFEIDSSPEGTRVRLSIPIHPELQNTTFM